MTGEIVRSIDYRDLHNVTAAGRSVVIDATKWEPNVEVLKGDVTGVQKGLAEIIPIIQQKNQEQRQSANFSGSVADELAKLKKLTDDGVMTQAEFQAQKDRLLNPAAICTDYFEDIPEEPTYAYEKKFDKAVQSNDKKAIVIRAVTFTVGAIIQLPVAIIFIHLILYHYGIVDELP